MLLRNQSRQARNGITLLEVLVSVAIFLLALVALSRLIGIATDLSRDANQQTECLRLAQSKLAEVSAGVIPLEDQADQPFEENDFYNWSLTCQETEAVDAEGYPLSYYVEVTVYRQRPDGSRMEVTLNHVILDPTKRGTTQPSTATTTGGGQ